LNSKVSQIAGDQSPVHITIWMKNNVWRLQKLENFVVTKFRFCNSVCTYNKNDTVRYDYYNSFQNEEGEEGEVSRNK